MAWLVDIVAESSDGSPILGLLCLAVVIAITTN